MKVLDAEIVEMPAIYNAVNRRKGRTPGARESRSRRPIDPMERRFIWWDGEGSQDNGPNNPQNYVLFGYVTDDDNGSIRDYQLTTPRLLDFIIRVGDLYPRAWHVGFAFDYDVNMILRGMPRLFFQKLHESKKRSIHWKIAGKQYRIEHYPAKWFRVTRIYENGKRTTVTIDDIFGFYQMSFAKAVRKNLAHETELMKSWDTLIAGKGTRNVFSWSDIETIHAYWLAEGKFGLRLIQELRAACYDPRVDIPITRWYGPGAMANKLFGRMGIRDHIAQPEIEDVQRASQYAYAGGRFEQFHVGRFTDVYSYDINSAYPAAMQELPSLTEGEWRYVTEQEIMSRPGPRKLAQFGIYHVRLWGPPLSKPSPLFHRDARGNITYPWRTEGWYMSPEAKVTRASLPPGFVDILEGWEYVGWHTLPFDKPVGEMYAQRRAMKLAGDGAEKALKLGLNSLYGKTAQRVGWDEEKKLAPKWHSLLWAAYITSWCRTQIYKLLRMIPIDKLIAVETDGLFTTATPDELHVEHSEDLGWWEISHYDEIIYLQSGMYALRDGDKWSHKYRGLNADTISPEKIVEHAKLLMPLQPGESWPGIQGKETRFIKYQAALQFARGDAPPDMPGTGMPFPMNHARWITRDKTVAIGDIGKRQHVPASCKSCIAGLGAWDRPHYLHTGYPRDIQSYPHTIPWLDWTDGTVNEDWRSTAEHVAGLGIAP